MQLNIDLQTCSLQYKYNVPVRIQHKQPHIKDVSVFWKKKGAKNNTVHENKLHEIPKNFDAGWSAGRKELA